MSHIRATYELHRYCRATDPDFLAALRLYSRLIPGPLRTSSNEITYWLEHYQKFNPDELCICGLYCNDTIIGYAEFAYLHQDRVITFDYLVLHEQHRSHGEYFMFVKLLQQWIDEQNWEIDYWVTEVPLVFEDSKPTTATSLVALLHQIGFAVANAPYFQPQLGVNNAQSDLASHFLIRPPSDLIFISSQAYLKLVEAVYFKYYWRWYEPFIDNPDDYKRLLKKRFSEIKSAAQQLKQIDLNGIIKSSDAPTSSPSPTRSKRKQNHINALCAAAVVLLVCFFLLLFQKLFERDVNTVLSLLGASILVACITFALFYTRGKWVLTQVLEFFISWSKRK